MDTAVVDKVASPPAASDLTTRNNILVAARQHLIEAGYRNLSLKQVAADAEVTRVTIYRKFGSKLGLLDASPKTFPFGPE